MSDYTPYYKGEPITLPAWLIDKKVDKETTNATTSVTDYLVSPYTMLSALPFGDSSLRLGDGSIFVHKDQMIASTMMVIYQNGLKTYTLAVDENTAEVTSITDQGSWMLSQVGLSVSDVYRDGSSGWVGTDHSLANVLSSLNTSLTNKTTWKYAGWGGSVTIPENYTEALIYIFGRNSNGTRRIGAMVTFLSTLWGEAVANKIEFLIAGYHVTDSDHGYANLVVTGNGKTFSIGSWTYGNTNAVSTYVMVYYR